MQVDLRARCARGRCNKLIRKSKQAQYEFEKYQPYCSYHCQQWHGLESAQAHLNSLKSATQ